MTKIIISEFIWENTLFCYLVQHMKKKTNTFSPLRKAYFRAEWNFEQWWMVLLLLIHLSPWAPSSCFGTTECCSNKNKWLQPDRRTDWAHFPAQAVQHDDLLLPRSHSRWVLVSSGKWPLQLLQPPPSPCCSRTLSYKQPPRGVFSPSPVNASSNRRALNEGKRAVWTRGIFMTWNMSCAFPHAALLQTCSSKVRITLGNEPKQGCLFHVHL